MTASLQPVAARDACRGRHSLAARAARCVSDATAGVACVLIVSENERAEAERLVGAHCASVNDKDPLAPVLVAGRLTRPVIVASGAEAGEFFATTGGSSGGGDFFDPARLRARVAHPFGLWATCDGLQARGKGLRVPS